MNKEKDLVISFPVNIAATIKAVVFSIISIFSFFVPFTLGHPQWLVGSIVNACLFLGAIYLPKKYFIPLAILPSLGVLARGVIFGPFTFILFYFLPIIWIGNFLLIVIFTKLFSKKNYAFSLFGASATKFLFLLIAAFIYFKFSIVPAIFLQAMGLNQLATALAGGLIAWLIFYAYRKRYARSKRVA